MGTHCLFCGDPLDIDAEFGRRNFCRYKKPDCNTEYNNFMRSLTKGEKHPNESIRYLARLLTERELSPLKPIKTEWMLLTRKRQPDQEQIIKLNNMVQVIYARIDSK